MDGFGGAYFGDDANLPSLLSLPYNEYCNTSDSVYKNTRKFLLSRDNPWFFIGEAGEGIGSPHGIAFIVYVIRRLRRGVHLANISYYESVDEY